MEVLTTKITRKELKLESAKIGIKCFNSFYFFFKTFWPEMSGEIYHDNWHIEYICNILQDKAMKLIRLEQIMETIVINVPPRSSKSTIVTIAFPLWVWLHRPNFTTTNISYSATLSKKHAHISRNITESKKWHLIFDDLFKAKHGKALEILKQNELEMLNNFKGSRFNTSVGGTITGMHANIIIEDDPLNPEEAHSETETANAIRFHDETVSTRLKNFTSYLNILIAQRLQEGDTCGHVLKQNLPITWICFPGELTKNTVVSPQECTKYYIDGILDPVGKPRIVLDQLKTKLRGAYSGQILQMPFNAEDQDITPGMFSIIKPKELPQNIVWDVWIDSAYTEKTENDPTGIDIIARIENKIVVKESYDVKKTLPDLLKFIIELEQGGSFDKQKSRIFIEPKASGYSLEQYIESDTDYNFVLIGDDNPSQRKLVAAGKKERHNMIKPKAESRRVVLVDGVWNQDFIMQIVGFPKALHDEHVDNLGYAINHYYMNENTFVDQKALNVLAKKVTDSVPIKLITSFNKSKIITEFQYNDKGNVQLFDEPNFLYKYRYVCVLTLRTEEERGGNTTIVVFDRMDNTVPAMYSSDTIRPKNAAKLALEIANCYDKAKLVVAVKKDSGTAQNEENDLSHIALREIRTLQYDNIYSRLTMNDIRHRREREFGFEVNRSTSREIFHNLKDQIETYKINGLPMEIYDEIKILERKKDTGEVGGREGLETNAVLAYAIGLKIHEEMYDKVTVKRSER